MTNAPVAILGFGAAGFNAATALRNGGYEGPIQVFSDIDTLPYSPILTSYYAAGTKTYDECFPWSAEEVADLALDVHGNSPVRGLDVAAHTVTTDEGTFPYSKCIIATGASPHALGFPPDCGYEPLLLRTMADAERLKSTLESPACRHILVSGASMVALKTVEAVLAHGKRVTLVGMNPHVLDFNALPEAAIRFERGLQKKGVELRLGQTIQSVEICESPDIPGDHSLAVTFSTGDTEQFDEIAVAHGMKCNLDFLPEGAIETDRAILVDEFMRTSDPDVYAAGDIVQATELISGEKHVVGIWKNAAEQGKCAGLAVAAELAGNAPDESCAFKGSISSNTIGVDGILFLSGGTMELGPNRRAEVREDDEMTVVYVYESDGKSPDERLVGFNITADHDEEGGVAYDTGAMLTLRILENITNS